ncbi:MAG: hypothetical protein R3A52_08055 [Polyangiales bacterium]
MPPRPRRRRERRERRAVVPGRLRSTQKKLRVRTSTWVKPLTG